MPEDTNLRELMGLAYYRQGKWAAAIKELEALYKLTASTAHHPILMDSFRALGRHKRTDELWEERGTRLLADVTWAPRDAPTPHELRRAYAANAARSAGERVVYASSAIRRSRRRRDSRSVSRASGPKTSDSSPAVSRRIRSIWNIRSCAVTYPCTNRTSSRFPARM